ncbi:putative glycerol-3-phosphate acyltransferase [Neospora caninum Liverpool]|uniref:Glycerol-3-phosphate acyltransferase, putative n=1 Tax=Neospora caninum (strain Liverpool) TaxID=572307 RepID=F0VJ95_NEOCL|nr:putative glycerol-3-phosphate acyltransferase [Neospora caninum Liverpool]CBZ53806.1 putative glycerol-3-phosphate acyltransferase [Neospora caninum Liverpool]CEL67800.1 TPA: glycerol-3-phosphate acyltransferase, putative [Neospora caninum Liverpool]|eukprot:XP_003883838.1 putative glycerol-3-phosphate acyltransferase [Neospora caninum Liverpool]
MKPLTVPTLRSPYRPRYRGCRRSVLLVFSFLALLRHAECSTHCPPSPVVPLFQIGVLPFSLFFFVFPSPFPSFYSAPLHAEAVAAPLENGRLKPTRSSLSHVSAWTPTARNPSLYPSSVHPRPSPVQFARGSRHASVLPHADLTTPHANSVSSVFVASPSTSFSCLSLQSGRRPSAFVHLSNEQELKRNFRSRHLSLPLSPRGASLSVTSSALFSAVPPPPGSPQAFHAPLAFVSPSAPRLSNAPFPGRSRRTLDLPFSSPVSLSPEVSLSPPSSSSVSSSLRSSSGAAPAWLPYGLPERLPEPLGRSSSVEALQKAKEHFLGLLEGGELTPASDERSREPEGSGQTSEVASSPRLTEKHTRIFSNFAEIYAREAAKSGQLTAQEYVDILSSLWQLAWKYAGYPFTPYHPALETPFNFAEWSTRLWRPLVFLPTSKIVVPPPSASPEFASPLGSINERLAAGENVVFLSNHQTEPDPQVVKLVFEHLGESALADKIVFVAGHKVREDRLSTPFSLACNLLCVHSKKHLTHPDLSAEEKHEKQRENLAAMGALQQLLEEGGSVIWVAPSGGRDRQDAKGVFSQPDPFDVKTVQMFRLLAKKIRQGPRGATTHFIPMALFTAPICPPPKQVETSLGEARSCAFSPVGVAIGESVTDEEALSHEDFARKAEAETKRLYKLITPRFE